MEELSVSVSVSVVPVMVWTFSSMMADRKEYHTLCKALGSSQSVWSKNGEEGGRVGRERAGGFQISLAVLFY